MRSQSVKNKSRRKSGEVNHTPNVLTIEHVLPQTVDAASEWAQNWPDVDERARWLHRLANLVPLNRARNSKGLNYDFDRKKSAYFAGTSGFAHMR